jgi:branched-chain amino acid aminotransferase
MGDIMTNSQIGDAYVYLNGVLLPLSEARISPLDYGFLYGFGLFETMRAYNRRVFRLEQHLNRLAESAEEIRIAKPVDTAELKSAIYKTLDANRLDDAYIRLTLSGGEGPVGLDPTGCKKLTTLIIVKEYTGYPAEKYLAGFRALTSSIKVHAASPTSRIKSINFLERLLAKSEAVKAGSDEAVMLNTEGFLAEGSVSNLFLVFGDVIHTPSLQCGILPGVTRSVVLELASQLNIRVVERRISLDEFYSADEAFLTNSLMEIMPLTEVNNKTLGTGRIGSLTKRLMHSYSYLVAKEVNAET